jgi:outer membrane protein assembly factor BamB
MTSSYNATESKSAVGLRTGPRWWGHPRTFIVLGVLAALVLALVAIGTPEETRLMALDAVTGRMQWSLTSTAPRERLIGLPVAGVGDNSGRVYLSVAYPPADTDLLPSYTWSLQSLEASSGRLLWEYRPDQTRFGTVAAEVTKAYTPVVSGTMVYVQLVNLRSAAWLVALDAATGQERWAADGVFFSGSLFRGLSSPLNNGTYYSGVAANGEQVFTLTTSTTAVGRTGGAVVFITAFAAPTGAVQWKTPILMASGEPSNEVQYLRADEDNVYLTLDKLYIFDGKTGALKSQVQADLLQVTADAMYQIDVTALTAIEKATGQPRWAFALTAGQNCFVPTISGDTLYMFCAMLASGTASAEPNATPAPTPTPIPNDQRNNPSTWDNYLIALDVRTGIERWRRPIAENPYTVVGQEPARASDVVAVVGGTLFGNLRVFAIDKDNAERWSLPVRRAYDQVGSDGARLYVVDRLPRWRYWLGMISPSLR